MTTSLSHDARPGERLSLSRFALTGAGTAAILFVLCWIGAALQVALAHNFISMFTTQAVASVGALGAGLLWSLVFGGGAGAIIAGLYNLFGVVERR